MADDDVTPEVPEQRAEAEQAHTEVAEEQPLPHSGEGNQPEGTGYAPPDTGAGESAESEIPVGADSIEPVEASGDDGGTEPIDLSTIDAGEAGDDNG
jgi:hypothetical protein